MVTSLPLPHSDWVEVGYILRPHGVRGELRMILHAPEEGFPKSIESVLLIHPKHGERTVKVNSARKNKDAILMMLDTVQDRDEAQRWKGAAVFADPDLLPMPEQGYHVYELVGTTVEDANGQCLGKVTGFLDNSAHFLLQIQGEGEEKLFPYVEEFIVGYDREKNALRVSVPDGLWDDDESSS